MLSNLKYYLATAATALAACSTSAFSIVEGSLADSEIYPGTVHTYSISIPEGYDGNTPACLFLGMDGISCNAPAHIDSLIASGDMPMTIGVYLQPGIVFNDAGEPVRYNRSNEFDATDGLFASFLEKELLPAVASTVLPDGRPVLISDNPSDRCIFGLSSGGIASFNAAWQRPDLFGRVFCGVGTFVPMRGGNDLEAIVRKHEPKPLKIFLQDGYSDTWNPTFGSWYEHNRLMETALEFAGYDCAFDWAEGGHSPARAATIFPLVMKWIWKSYPAAPQAGKTGNDTLAPLLVANSSWEECEPCDVSASLAPAIPYPDNSFVAFREISDGHLDQAILRNGAPTFRQRFYWPHSYNDNELALGGMVFDNNGNLWAVTDSGIQIFDQNGRVRGILELPLGIKTAGNASGYGIRIADGAVTLSDGRHAFTRAFYISAPSPGTRPASQGQG